MEILIMLAALIALGILANRFGHDSRQRPRSPEEELAATGFAWGSAEHAPSGSAAKSQAPEPRQGSLPLVG